MFIQELDQDQGDGGLKMWFAPRFRKELDQDQVRSIGAANPSAGLLSQPTAGVAQPARTQPSGLSLSDYIAQQRSAFQPVELPYGGAMSGEHMSDGPGPGPMSTFDEMSAVRDYNAMRQTQNKALTPYKLLAIDSIALSQHGAAGTLAGKIGYTGSVFDAYANGQEVGSLDGRDVSSPTYGVSADFRDALAGYNFTPADVSGNPGYRITDSSGREISTERTGDGESFFWDKLMPGAIAAGMAYFAGPALGGAFGGGLLGGAAGGAVTGGALAGATGGNVGQGLLAGGLLGGINGAMGGVPAAGGGLDPFTPDALKAWGQGAGVGVPDWESAISGINAPDLAQSFPVAPQPMPSWVDQVPGEIEQSLQQFAQQTPQQVQATMPDLPAPAWTDAVRGEVERSLQQAAVQTPEQVQSLIPDWQQPVPAWTDSVRGEVEQSLQQSAQQTPAQVNATMPEVSAIPQTLPTSGLSDFRKSELDGYQTDGAMPSPAVPDTLPTTGLSDFRADELKGYETDGRLPTSPAVPTGAGGLLGTLKGAGGTALDWMKANPGLAKLLLGGAGALLGGSGGSGGGGAAKQYGPAVQWKSPVSGIPQGLLGGGQAAGGQSGYPPAMGLLGGQPNSGAWRFLR